MSTKEFKLKINTDELDAYPYLDVPFSLSICLCNSTDELAKGHAEIPLQISLCGEDNQELNDAGDIISISPANVVLGSSGIAECKITFKKLSVDCGNRRFVLLVSALNSKEYYIKPAVSPPLVCVRYKLVIQEENKTPFIWFKDEGGREKCIELQVSLRNHLNEIVTCRKVKLRLTLCYAGGNVVSSDSQRILTVPDDVSRIISESNGQTVIRYRINEVSKGHQSQSFRVLISADVSVSPLNADIAPCHSTPVEVRSKRNNTNKRQRESAVCSVFDSTTLNPNNSMNNLNGAEGGVPKKTRGKGQMQTQSRVGQVAPSTQSDNTYVSALNCLVNFNNLVITKLGEIEWKVVDYIDNDQSRPVYKMTNPNFAVQELLDSYANTVVSNAKFLLKLNADNFSTLPAFTDPTDISLEDSSKPEEIGPVSHSFSNFMNSDDFGGLTAGSGDGASDLMRNHSLFLHPLSSTYSITDVGSSDFNSGGLEKGSVLGMNNGANMSSVPIESVESKGYMPSAARSSKDPFSSDSAYVLPTGYFLGDGDLLSSSNNSTNVNRLINARDFSAHLHTGRQLGCPAFSSMKKLTGFYTSSRNYDGTSVIMFFNAVPDSSVFSSETDIKLSPAEYSFLENLLEAAVVSVQTNPNGVATADQSCNEGAELFRLEEFGGDVSKMVDSALITCWLSYGDGNLLESLV